MFTAEAGQGAPVGDRLRVLRRRCFGASALYHRPTWQPRARSWLARLDHAGIYLLIAGTYTPFGLLVLSRGWAVAVSRSCGPGRRGDPPEALLAGKTEEALRGDRPRPRVGRGHRVLAAPEAARRRARAHARRGLAYSLGAIVYARRPDPFPRVLGYHEVFHVLTIVAAGCQYATIAFYVLPRG